MSSLKFSLLILSACLSQTYCTYSGPFLLWGIDNLNGLKIPTLESIDDSVLRDIYSKSAAIVLFLRNKTNKLSNDNFPELSGIISKNEWLYLPQDILPINPLEFNENAEVINLVGDPHQQDTEIAAFFKDAEMNYGDRKVLGILATRNDEYEHGIYKRQAEALTTQEPTTTMSPDDPVEDNFIYVAKGKGIMYLTGAPILRIADNQSDEGTVRELRKHSIVTSDERDSLFKLIVSFATTEGKVYLRFRFRIFSGYWSLNEVEYEDSRTSILSLSEGAVPTAPIGFSYKCSNKIVFKNGSISLTLENIQVQPLLLPGEEKFSNKVFDCIGFTSAPILAGVFVTFLVGIVMTIAITAILEIKPPNRFESRTGKQLTFTVSE